MARPDGPDEVERTIVPFLTSSDPDEIEALADGLGSLGDVRAVGPLAARLADSRIHDDPDLEDAVCSSLVRLGVMNRLGNLNYAFADPPRLSPESAAVLGRLDSVLPRRYFRAC